MKKRTSKRAAKKKAQKTIEEVKDLDLSVDSSGEGGEDEQGTYLSVPSFLLKTYEIVDDDQFDQVKWTPDGKAFIIINPNDLSDKVLPLFFKHKNLSSFIR